MNKAWRLAWLPLLAGAGPAHAHGAVPGIEGFYVGVIHPFSTPSQVLVMLGLGLLACGFTVDKARWVLAGFLVASLSGMVLGPRDGIVDAIVFATAFVASAVAAIGPGKLLPVAIGLACIAGFIIGTLSIPDDGPVRDRLFTMSGSFLGANLGLLYLLGINHITREYYTSPLTGIAFRIAAAWLGAIALLMLALGFAQTAAAP